jgi:UDP-glucose:(heptosyl)LPS alpha-1,3-glucosyltransferase
MERPLKIAMLVRAFATDGGLELYAHRVVEGLLKQGHQVTVICQNKRSDFTHANLSFKTIEGRSDRLPKIKRLQHDYAAGNAVLAECADQFDLVHSQHYPTSFADVVTFHNHSARRWSHAGLPWERKVNDAKCALVPAYKLRDQYDQELCRNARCRVFPSRVMQQDYYDTYLINPAEAPYMVAFPGSSMPSSQTTQPDKKADKPFTFLFVGRGFRRKGLDVVLGACAELARSGKKFQLLIAGLKEKPIDKIRLNLLGLQGKVSYLGFRNDMDTVFREADAAVLPSRVEPFGMAPLQAMSFGLVPIVSRVSGVSEVLTDRQDCLILENHLDCHELAKLMDELLSNPQLLADLRRNAPSTAAKVNWDQTVTSTLNAYELALQTARPAAVK